MKFPSLFRMPRHQRFKFEPRYYDPIKEDIERRTQEVKAQLSQSQTNNYRTTISNSFERKSRRGNKTSLFQLVLILVLSISFVGYLYFGPDVLYGLLIAIGGLVWARIKGFF